MAISEDFVPVEYGEPITDPISYTPCNEPGSEGCCCHDGSTERSFDDHPTIEDESLRNEGDDDDDDTEEEYSICNTGRDGITESILCETAMMASNELSFMSSLASECRKQVFELILKSDLDKEKIMVRIGKLQEFLASTEKRTDELVARIERLLRPAAEWSITHK